MKYDLTSRGFYFQLLLLVCFLLTISSTAEDNWTLIGKTEQVTYYINSTDLERYPTFKRVWIMAKYKEPLLNGQAYKTISQVDFDSSKRRFRQYFIIAYDLSDQVIHSDHTGTEEWSPIPPGTSFWDTAWAYCQKL